TVVQRVPSLGAGHATDHGWRARRRVGSTTRDVQANARLAVVVAWCRVVGPCEPRRAAAGRLGTRAPGRGLRSAFLVPIVAGGGRPSAPVIRLIRGEGAR